MSAVTPARPVDINSRLSPAGFYAGYVNRKPLVMRGAVCGLPSVSHCSARYVLSLAPDLRARPFFPISGPKRFVVIGKALAAMLMPALKSYFTYIS